MRDMLALFALCGSIGIFGGRAAVISDCFLH